MATLTIRSVDELKELEGQEVGASDWVEITQQRIHQFADVTDDHQWIHEDVERAAKESPYKTTIAHGFLSLSLVSMLLQQAVKLELGFQRLINYGLNRVRFPAAVPAGSKVRGRFRVQKVEEISDGLQITWHVTIETPGSEKPCVVAEWLVRAYRSP